MSMRKVDRVKKRFVMEGMETALTKKKGSRIYEKKTDGDFEAHLVALSCSEPPEGFSRWSLRMLADKVIELGYIDSISYEAVRSILKKMKLNPGKKRDRVIPPEHNGSFVANMETVLDVYKRPLDPKNPVVCMDECPKHSIAETGITIPALPGQPEKGKSNMQWIRVCVYSETWELVKYS